MAKRKVESNGKLSSDKKPAPEKTAKRKIVEKERPFLRALFKKSFATMLCDHTITQLNCNAVGVSMTYIDRSPRVSPKWPKKFNEFKGKAVEFGDLLVRFTRKINGKTEVDKAFVIQVKIAGAPEGDSTKKQLALYSSWPKFEVRNVDKFKSLKENKLNLKNRSSEVYKSGFMYVGADNFDKLIDAFNFHFERVDSNEPTDKRRMFLEFYNEFISKDTVGRSIMDIDDTDDWTKLCKAIWEQTAKENIPGVVGKSIKKMQSSPAVGFIQSDGLGEEIELWVRIAFASNEAKIVKGEGILLVHIEVDYEDEAAKKRS